jgi:hypothetical protein
MTIIRRLAATVLATLVVLGLSVTGARASDTPTASLFATQACTTNPAGQQRVLVLWDVLNESGLDSTPVDAVVTDATRNPHKINGALAATDMHVAWTYVVPGNVAHLGATVTFADGTVRHLHARVPAWTCSGIVPQ